MKGWGTPQAAISSEKPYAIGIGRLPPPGNKPAIQAAILCNFLSRLALGRQALEQRIAALVGREEALDADFLQGDVLRRPQGGDGSEDRERLVADDVVERQQRRRAVR